MLERDLGELVGGDALDGLAPEPGGLEHVRLVHRGHLGGARCAARAGAGGVEGDPGDPLDLLDRVGAVVVGAVAVAPRVAEVDAAGELAHDQQVGALDPLAPQRAGVEQRLAGPHRAQVGEQAQALAQAQQPLLGPRRVGVGGLPLRAADRAEQDRVGLAAGLEHLVGQRRAVGVDRGAADRVALVDLDPAERLEQAHRGGPDLGPDPVAGQEDDRLLTPASAPRG